MKNDNNEFWLDEREYVFGTVLDVLKTDGKNVLKTAQKRKKNNRFINASKTSQKWIFKNLKFCKYRTFRGTFLLGIITRCIGYPVIRYLSKILYISETGYMYRVWYRHIQARVNKILDYWRFYGASVGYCNISDMYNICNFFL